MRGVVLYVDEVVFRGWFRSHIRARARFLGDDRSEGVFSALQFAGLRDSGPVIVQTDIRVKEGEPIHLVCRGRKWKSGDAIPQEKIVYRYEP